ncbi:HlyC/CorC family transporter [Hujiaoplasma nucleasis]|uniref:HlyC/CorC family transporter n=1 Tax=Hujiaoplasma nucleasis TaxID=2725268 RepID=A0A7L6N299_9MOLU|nr:hemolysin family protein [Hujiaoplasma nucleasis]QLY39347.1 HlyC/CorC family transporter [Hujiaoplasma nucleasis]
MEIELILLFILILIIINGYFAASEMALVSVKQSKIDDLIKNGNKKAVLLKKIKSDSTRYLSTIQVAITLAGFLSSALAGSNLSDNLVQILANININIPQNIAVILITVVLSYITLVFGELVPKRIALLNPLRFSLSSVRVVYFAMIITKPAVWLLSKTTKGILNILGIKKRQGDNELSESEIKSLIRHGHSEGLYQTQEKEMLENIFNFDDIHAEAIMTPRTNVYAIDIEDTLEEILNQIMESRYSRIPIYEDNIDNILGIIHVKDILISAKKIGFDNLDIKKLLRKPYYVPTSIKINKLFRKMQENNYQMAIILDDYGGMEGVITIEDLIEEIVGNIYDEYDPIEEEIKQISDHQYLVNGTMSIQDINRYLNIYIDTDNETLSGLIIDELEYIPKATKADVVYHKNYVFEVKSVINNRIDKVLITIEKELS